MLSRLGKKHLYTLSLHDALPISTFMKVEIGRASCRERVYKCFFPNLLSIQAISIFQSNVCCKNHFSLVTFFHAICLLSKRFFSDESEKVWKSAETNTKIHLKDMVLVDDLLSLLFPIEFV